LSAGLALDAVIALLLVTTGGLAIASRTLLAAVVAFAAHGLLLALAWVRLAAPDVALTEAAVGALTGVLLLGAATRLRPGEPAAAATGTNGAQRLSKQPGAALRAAAALGCAVIAAGLAAVVLAAPDPAPTLAPAAARHLPETGLGNPVTAALLAWRAIDTLLEKVVLLAGLLAVWSLAPDRLWGGRPGAPHRARTDDALAFLARLLPPIGIVVGVYLVWTAADHPGGAFPGSTILAAMWVLARMAGLVDAPAIGDRRLRAALVAGPLAFFAVGFAGFAWADGFLSYPEGWAKPLIVAIEVPMTLSVAATLALLLAGPPARDRGARE
jgi:multisubunit Na+/H+ antiporter MnhB subunit